MGNQSFPSHSVSVKLSFGKSEQHISPTKSQVYSASSHASWLGFQKLKIWTNLLRPPTTQLKLQVKFLISKDGEWTILLLLVLCKGKLKCQGSLAKRYLCHPKSHGRPFWAHAHWGPFFSSPYFQSKWVWLQRSSACSSSWGGSLPSAKIFTASLAIESNSSPACPKGSNGNKSILSLIETKITLSMSVDP